MGRRLSSTVFAPLSILPKYSGLTEIKISPLQGKGLCLRTECSQDVGVQALWSHKVSPVDCSDRSQTREAEWLSQGDNVAKAQHRNQSILAHPHDSISVENTLEQYS